MLCKDKIHLILSYLILSYLILSYLINKFEWRLAMIEDTQFKRAAELRHQAEMIALEKAVQSPENLETLSIDDIRKKFHELNVHQIELEIQNEELKRTQLELDIIRERYFDLYDLAPVGYCTISEKGLVLEANLTAVKLLGVNSEEIVMRPITKFILNEDQDKYYLFRKKLFETCEPQLVILRMLKKDGSQFWSSLSATVTQDADGASKSQVIICDITEEHKRSEDLQFYLSNTETLLKEIHHRVKNNMTIIMSLINLQRAEIKDEATQNCLVELNVRIKSMALVHELLYASNNFDQICFQDYLDQLVIHLRSAFRLNGNIIFNATAIDCNMNINTAIPCGLIVAELITNAFKHAFPPNKPSRSDGNHIDISMEFDSNSYTLTVADNGVGLPLEMDWMNTNTLGLNLIKILGHQLRGQVELDRTGGTTFQFKFPPAKESFC
jgi:PAS domain S-box-containing protein